MTDFDPNGSTLRMLWGGNHPTPLSLISMWRTTTHPMILSEAVDDPRKALIAYYQTDGMAEWGTL